MFGKIVAQDHKLRKRTVNNAYKKNWITTGTGHSHHPLQEEHIHILHDSTHPAHSLFTCLLSSKCLQGIRARTMYRLKHSFYPQAIRLQNNILLMPLIYLFIITIGFEG